MRWFSFHILFIFNVAIFLFLWSAFHHSQSQNISIDFLLRLLLRRTFSLTHYSISTFSLYTPTVDISLDSLCLFFFSLDRRLVRSVALIEMSQKRIWTKAVNIWHFIGVVCSYYISSVNILNGFYFEFNWCRLRSRGAKYW